MADEPPSIRCEYATSEDACRQARRQSGSAHLACARTGGGESSRQTAQDTRQLHTRARVRRASLGSMAPKCSTIVVLQQPHASGTEQPTSRDRTPGPGPWSHRVDAAG